MSDADVILEVPAEWFENPLDRERHQRLYASLLVALAELRLTLRPLTLPYGADGAPRLYDPGQLVISFHSHGTEGNVLRIKDGYWPGYYTFDPIGFSGFSKLAQSPDAYSEAIDAVEMDTARAFVDELRHGALKTNLSKYPQPDLAALDLPKDYVFLPLQRIDDPTAWLARLDPFDVARALAQAARDGGQDGGRPLVIKRHPLCGSSKVTAALAALSRDFPEVVLTDGPVHELINGAAVVVGANSGVLFEALVHGKRVITFGGSDFESVTTPVHDLDRLVAALDPPDGWNAEAQTRFVAWYLGGYALRADDIDGIRDRITASLAVLDITPCDHDLAQRELFAFHAEAERARRAAFEPQTPPPWPIRVWRQLWRAPK